MFKKILSVFKKQTLPNIIKDKVLDRLNRMEKINPNYLGLEVKRAFAEFLVPKLKDLDYVAFADTVDALFKKIARNPSLLDDDIIYTIFKAHLKNLTDNINISEDSLSFLIFTISKMKEIGDKNRRSQFSHTLLHYAFLGLENFKKNYILSTSSLKGYYTDSILSDMSNKIFNIIKYLKDDQKIVFTVPNTGTSTLKVNLIIQNLNNMSHLEKDFFSNFIKEQVELVFKNEVLSPYLKKINKDLTIVLSPSLNTMFYQKQNTITLGSYISSKDLSSIAPAIRHELGHLVNKLLFSRRFSISVRDSQYTQYQKITFNTLMLREAFSLYDEMMADFHSVITSSKKIPDLDTISKHVCISMAQLGRKCSIEFLNLIKNNLGDIKEDSVMSDIYTHFSKLNEHDKEIIINSITRSFNQKHYGELIERHFLKPVINNLNSHEVLWITRGYIGEVLDHISKISSEKEQIVLKQKLLKALVKTVEYFIKKDLKNIPSPLFSIMRKNGPHPLANIVYQFSLETAKTMNEKFINKLKKEMKNMPDHTIY